MIPELEIFEEKMSKTVGQMETEFSSIRAGRANPAVLDKLLIDYYGVPTKVNQMASVAVTEARILTITPYDKSALKDIEKAIQASDIGINPNNDGSVLRLNFPPLTEERRKEICKNISRMAEETKIAIRSIRRDANDKIRAMKKAVEITEDDQKILEQEIQKLTDKFTESIEKISADKEKDIMVV